MGLIEELKLVLEPFRERGHQTLSDGTELIGRALHVGSEAWLHVFFRPLSAMEVAGLEGKLPGPLPATFRRFLEQANGLSLFVDAIAIFGLRTQYSRGCGPLEPYNLLTPNTIERPSDLPDTAMVVGSYNWDGSLLCIDREDQVVSRRDRDSAAILNRWQTFDQMLLQETRRLVGLFDSDGRPRYAAVPTTPSMEVA